MGQRLISIVLFASLCLASIPGCQSQDDQEPQPDFSGIGAVCELATLKCYYHNVAISKVDAHGPFGWFFKNGYKRLWIEYDGIVNVGIDVSEVEIVPDYISNVVRVHIPDVKVLDIKIDKNSVSKPLFELGFLTSISAEEKTDAMAIAQKNMKKTAKKDKPMLKRAHQRAKELIEGYVINVGKTIGKDYKVEWI